VAKGSGIWVVAREGEKSQAEADTQAAARDEGLPGTQHTATGVRLTAGCAGGDAHGCCVADPLPKPVAGDNKHMAHMAPAAAAACSVASSCSSSGLIGSSGLGIARGRAVGAG
jgi:hypothetical protein